jgi:hypothetical protein
LMWKVAMSFWLQNYGAEESIQQKKYYFVKTLYSQT